MPPALAPSSGKSLKTCGEISTRKVLSFPGVPPGLLEGDCPTEFEPFHPLSECAYGLSTLQSIEQPLMAVGLRDDELRGFLLLEPPHVMLKMALELSDGTGPGKIDDREPSGLREFRARNWIFRARRSDAGLRRASLGGVFPGGVPLAEASLLTHVFSSSSTRLPR